MKIRQKLEDFKVEEISKFNILKKGKFKLYLLEKRGLESFSLINYLAKQNNIPPRLFGAAGLKDRHAITRQYFTIPSKYEIKTLKEKNFDIKFFGFVDKGLRLGKLMSNKFKIVVRNLRKVELDEIYKRAELIKIIGVPNYFDSQRFGSVIARKFIGKFVVVKNYEEAVKIHLTHYNKHDKDKAEKKLIFKKWNKLIDLNIKNHIIDTYKETKSWFKAYKKIPSHLRKMYLSAYQSYLWNECVKEMLVDDVYSVDYSIGSLKFYKKVNRLPVAFPLVNYNARYSADEKKVLNKILVREKLKISDFNLESERFPLGVRRVILKPLALKISRPRIDELNKNRHKVTLSFSLFSGSYATIIVKRIFC